MANPDDPVTLSTGQLVAISIAVVFVWTFLDALRSDVQGWFNNVAIFIQIAGSLSIVITLLVLSPQNANANDVFLAGYDIINVTQNVQNVYRGMPVSAYTVVIGLTGCLFAFTGYEVRY